MYSTFPCSKCGTTLKIKTALIRMVKAVKCGKCGNAQAIPKELQEQSTAPASAPAPAMAGPPTASLTPSAAGASGVSFTCGGCAKRLTISAGMIGKRVKCGKCGKISMVPAASEPVLAPAPTEPPPPAPEPPVAPSAEPPVASSAEEQVSGMMRLVDEPEPAVPAAASPAPEALAALESQVAELRGQLEEKDKQLEDTQRKAEETNRKIEEADRKARNAERTLQDAATRRMMEDVTAARKMVALEAELSKAREKLAAAEKELESARSGDGRVSDETIHKAMAAALQVQRKELDAILDHYVEDENQSLRKRLEQMKARLGPLPIP